MTTPLTSVQILSLAPDPAAAKAGAALATARKWSRLGGDGRAIWGECQGSGAQPYQSRVDLSDLGSRCSCPSRKFPCKHALGLLVLFAAEPELFAAADPPAWVAEWLASRTERADRRATKPDPRADTSTVPDATAQARRTAARAAKVSAGLDELGRWLRDLVRVGIASAPSRPAAFWDAMAARLVDAQAPGAARLVRQLAVIPSTGAGWPERMLAQLGRLHLLVEGYARAAELPAAARADVRTHVGFPVTEAELAAEPGVVDRWTVIGQVVESEDRLRVRRSWLAGANTRRIALLLDFAHGAAAFVGAVPPVGATLHAELVFHPGSYPQRAVLRASVEPPHEGAVLPPRGDAKVVEATREYACALASDPWTERVVFVLAAVTPESHAVGWQVRDTDGDVLPIATRFHAGWSLLALAGGHPVWLSGEWDGKSLFPLAASAAGAPPVALTGTAAT